MARANRNNSDEHELCELHHGSKFEQNANSMLVLSISASVADNTDNLRNSDASSNLAQIIFSKLKSCHMAVFGSALFICIVMVIGILTVCLTSPNPNKSCQSSFQAVIDGNSFLHDSKPRCVATGDFNHDHLLDIVVVNPGTNNIGIFINYGNGTFTSQITFTTGNQSRPFSVAVHDFNNDTHLDIAVANYDSHNIGIFLGYGNGTFANQTTFFIGTSRPVSIAIGDLNNDLYLDIVVTSNGTNNIDILFGYEYGSFGNQITYSTGYDSHPYFVVVNDLNNDHYLDIVVANYGTDNIGVFIGYGNGSFMSQTIYSTSLRSNPSSIAVNDVNNDGQLDIAVANSGTNDVGIFFGYGNGSFMSQKTYSISPGSNPYSIIIGDFNQDNQLDIAVSNYDTDNISILIGNDNGNFATPTVHSTGIDSSPSGITIGDFDNNNQSDIAIANSGTNNVFVLMGYSIVQSQNPTAYSAGVGARPYQIATGDFNNDTQLDLVVANYGITDIGVFLGYGNGSFREQTKYSTGNNSNPRGVAVSDLDNDHRLDVIVPNFNSESLGILYGYGNGSFATVITYFTGDSSSPRWVTIDDVNNDGHRDIIFVDYGTNSIGIILGYGNRTFGELKKFFSGVSSRPYSTGTGDFNNDGRLDIALVCHGTDNIDIFLGFGDGTFTLFGIYSTQAGSLPHMLTVADLNKDTYLDVIVANSGTNNVGVFYGYGNGSFAPQFPYSTGSASESQYICIADLNNDSWLDIAVANPNIQSIGVFLNNQQGYFGEQTSYPTGSGSSPISVVVGDFNKDNRLDIAVSNDGTNNVAILLGHSSEDSKHQSDDVSASHLHPSSVTAGYSNPENQSNSTTTNRMTNNTPLLLGDYYANFRSQTAYSTGSTSRPYSVGIGDLNNDAHMDLIVANAANENIGILLGYGNGSFGIETTYSTGIGSNPQSVVVGDFNKDNKLDVVVNNPRNDSIILLLGNGDGTFSTEMIYSTGPGSNPSTLAVANFDNNHYLDLAVAHQGTDTIGIFFGYDYTLFSRQKPYESGENSQPYSVVVADLNNDGHLDIVSALYNSNNVGVLLGYGNGTFAPIMTYAYLSSSHPWSVGVGDFNNDNQLDITVACLGIDSISVVLGYGNGSFANPILYPTGSGSRPVSVAVGDFNNDSCLDITAANHDGESIAVFLGYGNGSFGILTTFSTGKSSRPKSVIVSDINNDIVLDIIIVDQVINNVGIFLGYGNGSFAEQMTFSTGADSSPRYAIAGDFNKDGNLDLAIANYATSNVGILYGYGNGTFGKVKTYSTGVGSSPTNVQLGDFNNDNQLDIIVSDITSRNVGVFFGYDDGTFASISIVPVGQSFASYSVAVGDFNNDSRLDFTVADSGNDNIGVFLANGSKPFGGQTTFFVGEGTVPSSIAVGHFNNDSHLDIAIANYGTSNMGIVLGYGNRMFSNVTTYSTGNDACPIALAIGDLNNDSINDIVVANSKSNDIVVFIGYGNGSFSSLVTYSMGENSQPMSIAVGDFNRDYQLDIAVANFGTNNACILFGSGNGMFRNQTYYPLGYRSRPSWVVFKDLNNDGWEDIVVVTPGIENINNLLNLC